MSTTYTTNYHLGKQTDTSDNFNMSVITDNMDTIDTVLGNKADNSTTYTKTEVDTAIAEKATVLDIYGGGQIIPDNSDLNNYKTVGVYGVLNSSHAATISNIPVGGSGFRLIVSGINGGTGYVRQEYIKGNQPGIIYIRHFTGNWSSWYKFEGTTLT